MSLKENIMNLVNEKEASFRINKISYLTRLVGKDIFGNDIDELFITFDFVSGIKGGKVYHNIVARDYDGIIKEISKKTELYLKECTAKIISNLENGYIE